MWGRRKIRSLMAAALYDELAPEERREFERLLAASPKNRNEYEALRRLVDGVPIPPVALNQDLLPGIRARLAEADQASHAPWGRIAAVTGACMLGAVFILAGAYVLNSPAQESMVAGVQRSYADTPVSAALREAAALRAQRDYGTAFQVLQTAVSVHPEDSYAGQAQQQLAAMYYEQFGRYRDAHHAYAVLRSQYPEVFMDSPENIRRLDILEEARRVEYVSLESLDWARSRRDDAVDAFTEVISQYPTTQVATLAIQEMTRRYLDTSHAYGESLEPLEALERLRDRCNDPVVAGRLDVEIGRSYWHEYADAERARGVGTKALGCGDPGVVEMAQGFLQQLETGATSP